MSEPRSQSTRVRAEEVRRRAGELLARYRSLLEDWDAFLAALERPKRTCIVANAARTTAAQLAELLDGEHGRLDPVPWAPGALRVPADARPGTWWGFLAGLYQVQEEASLLPVALLEPRPGERVLDLCAAPGGKAAQIALAVGRGGTVIANDKDPRRLNALRDRMKRLGLVNLTTTAHDGGAYPLAAGGFDRVLVDAPCTSEGTKFRTGAAYLACTQEFRHWIAGQQAALLRRAARLVKPGGRVVYATCSFAPEENEAVVDRVLAELDGALVPVAVRPPGLDPAPAVRHWRDRDFAPAVAAGVRLWPHCHDTGGFFAIALERPTEAGAPAPVGPADPGARQPASAALESLMRPYDLPAEALADLAVCAKGEHLQLVAAEHRPPAEPPPVSTGVPVCRRNARHEKPTTVAALLLGAGARRNVVELDAGQRDAYHRRARLHPRAEQLAACAPGGFVILRYRGVALGCGLLRPGPPPWIDSQYPRAWTPHWPA